MHWKYQVIFQNISLSVFFVFVVVRGLLEGVVFLIPNLDDATRAIEGMGEGETRLAEAIEGTSSCGSSGSNTSLLIVAEGNIEVAESIFALNSALTNETSESGQLRLLTGDLSEIPTTTENVAKKMQSLNRDRDILIDNIDSVSFDGADQLLNALKYLKKSIVEFKKAFDRTTGVSNLVLKVVSVPVISGFTNSLDIWALGYKKESEAFKSLEETCQISTGLPEITNELYEIVFDLYKDFEIL